MNRDGSGRAKVVPYPVSTIMGVSPGRQWVMAVVPVPEGRAGVSVRWAIPVDGKPTRVVCASWCIPQWSSGGDFLVIPVEDASLSSPGRSLAIPVGPGESLPEFPPGGIRADGGTRCYAGSPTRSRAVNSCPARTPTTSHM